MTREDFELIASIIQVLDVSENTRRSIALDFGHALYDEGVNPQFDVARFVNACVIGANVRARSCKQIA